MRLETSTAGITFSAGRNMKEQMRDILRNTGREEGRVASRPGVRIAAGIGAGAPGSRTKVDGVVVFGGFGGSTTFR